MISLVGDADEIAVRLPEELEKFNQEGLPVIEKVMESPSPSIAAGV